MTDDPSGSSETAERKRTLRSQLRERRRGLDPTARAAADSAINRAILELAGELPDGAVAAFRAFDGEPDLSSALVELARLGRQVALPVLEREPAPVHLRFRAWNPAAVLERNGFGIDEPRDGQPVSLDEIGLLLVPLVGWDRAGGRLGMGAGYYDRALAGRAGDSRPLRAGIAYAAQRVERIPTDIHDVRLHLVISEEGRFTCPP